MISGMLSLPPLRYCRLPVNVQIVSILPSLLFQQRPCFHKVVFGWLYFIGEMAIRILLREAVPLNLFLGEMDLNLAILNAELAPDAAETTLYSQIILKNMDITVVTDRTYQIG